MPARASASRTSGTPLKSPLAAPSGRCPSPSGPATRVGRANLEPRDRQLADLADHLRSITNRWAVRTRRARSARMSIRPKPWTHG